MMGLQGGGARREDALINVPCYAEMRELDTCPLLLRDTLINVPCY